MTEEMSAWMDGELGSDSACARLLQLIRDADLHAKWGCYHLIGDALRDVWAPDLSAKICARLDAEPTVCVPQRRPAADKFRWHAMSMAAGVAAVAVVGWVLVPGTLEDAPPNPVNAIPMIEQVAAPAGESAKDYLLAHQRYSLSNAMAGVAMYVRVVAEARNPHFSTP